MRSRGLPARLLYLSCLLGPLAAWSHAGPTEPTSIRFRPDAPEQIALGTSFGVVLHEGDASPWRVICSEAIGYDETFAPVVHWSADGTLFVGSLKGLWTSRDGGCDWTPHPTFELRGVTDLRPAPGDARTLFATSGKFGTTNGLFKSTDEGVTFGETSLLRPETLFTGIRFAPGQPSRAYVSAWYFSPASAWLFRSDDGGETFEQLNPTVPSPDAFSVLGVDPTNADHLFANAFDGTEYLLLRSTDGGESFTEVGRDDRIFRDVEFSADGQQVFAASGARLYRSNDGGETFSRALPPIMTGCVAEHAGTFFVCGSSVDGFALATTDGAAPLERTFVFPESVPLSCPQGTPGYDECAPLWSALADRLAADPTYPDYEAPDAGVSPVDAGTSGDGGETSDPPPAGCGCTGTNGVVLPLVALLWFGTRRQRIRRWSLGLFALLMGCGTRPMPVEPCAPNPCTEANRTVCTATGDAFSCACDPGFEEREGACFAPDPCRPNPCSEPNRTVCIPDGESFSCGCDEGLVLVGETCEPPVDCGGQHLEGDAFEPDECPELARDIGGSGEQQESHTLSPAADEDWFRIDPAANFAWRFEVRGEGGSLRLDVYTGDALSPVASRTDETGLIDLAVKARTTDRLYARVRGTAASYAISIGNLGPDDHGDTLSEGTRVLPDTDVYGAFQWDGDPDVLTFEVDARTVWSIDTAWEVAGHGELKTELLAEDGTVLQSGPSLFVYALSAGTRHLRLGSTSGRFGGGWRARITALGPDDHADDGADPLPVIPGTSLPGSFERPGDVDVVRFDALASHIYEVRCTPAAGADCFVELRAPDGTLLGSDFDDGTGLLFHEMTASGTHTVSLSGTEGPWTLRIDDLGLDDHGDDLGTPTVLAPMPLNVTGTANFETPGDRDVLAFLTDSDHIYRISCDLKTASDCNVRVFNPTGVPVASDVDGGGARVLYEFNGGGTYYVELSGAPHTVGTVTWTIEDLWHDDHGDDPFTGTSILVNGAWNLGELQTPVDRDHFRFNAVAGRIHKITCQRETLVDCDLRLWDLTGVVLASSLQDPDPVILWTPTATAPLSAEVRVTGGRLGTYLLKVEDLGVPAP